MQVKVDGNSKLDFSDVASEKLTFVRVGDKLIVLFDNQSTVTIDPVFGQDGHPRADLAFAMGADRTLSGDQFAELFPITTDQSVLPAAGPGGAARPPARISATSRSMRCRPAPRSICSVPRPSARPPSETTIRRRIPLRSPAASSPARSTRMA